MNLMGRASRIRKENGMPAELKERIAMKAQEKGLIVQGQNTYDVLGNDRKMRILMATEAIKFYSEK